MHLLFFPLLLASALAFEGWDFRMCTNKTVSAGRPLLVKAINNRTQNVQSGWDSISIALAKGANYADATQGQVCTLIDCMPIDTTDFTVTISPAWGPSDYSYDLASTLFSASDLDVPSYYNTNKSSLTYTNGWNAFNVTGMTGASFDFESHPRAQDRNEAWPLQLDIVPCEAYQCARVCVDKHYASLDPSLLDYTDIKTCIQECPGVNSTTNYCPKAGGTTTAPASMTTFVPDGCIEFAGDAYPEAAASASSSAKASLSSAIADFNSRYYTATPTPTGPSNGAFILHGPAVPVPVGLAVLVALTT